MSKRLFALAATLAFMGSVLGARLTAMPATHLAGAGGGGVIGTVVGNHDLTVNATHPAANQT